MTALIIDRSDAELSFANGAIEMRVGKESLRRFPLRGVNRLLLHGSLVISSKLLSECWDRKISVLFISGRRQEAKARFYGNPHNDAGIRVAQIMSCFDQQLKCRIIRMILKIKLQQQIKTLKYLASTRADGRHRASYGLKLVQSSLSELKNNPKLDPDQMRGLEGAAAAGYFKSYSRFFAPSLGFDKRRRRPPPDPVNAALSLSYTIATFEAGQAAHRVGLDPSIGTLHDLYYGRDALALDFVEIQRPIIDKFVHNLFQTGILTKDHFTPQPGGGMLLGKAGRKHFYEMWEEFSPSLRKRADLIAVFSVKWLQKHKPLPPENNRNK